MNYFTGTIIFFASKFQISGFLICNGEEVPIGQFRQLFEVIGTTYGGDGRTTFALPNLPTLHPSDEGYGQWQICAYGLPPQY